jgi:hypothetical protein
VGPVSSCGRELLRGWWLPIGLTLSFMIFTVSVWNVLDTPSYSLTLHLYVSASPSPGSVTQKIYKPY